MKRILFAAALALAAATLASLAKAADNEVTIGYQTSIEPAKVAIAESEAAKQITVGIDAAERRVRAAVPIATTIYLEPDIYRPQKADRTDPSIRAAMRDRSPRRDRPKNPGAPTKEDPAP